MSLVSYLQERGAILITGGIAGTTWTNLAKTGTIGDLTVAGGPTVSSGIIGVPGSEGITSDGTDDEATGNGAGTLAKEGPWTFIFHGTLTSGTVRYILSLISSSFNVVAFIGGDEIRVREGTTTIVGMPSGLTTGRHTIVLVCAAVNDWRLYVDGVKYTDTTTTTFTAGKPTLCQYQNISVFSAIGADFSAILNQTIDDDEEVDIRKLLSIPPGDPVEDAGAIKTPNKSAVDSPINTPIG